MENQEIHKTKRSDYRLILRIKRLHFLLIDLLSKIMIIKPLNSEWKKCWIIYLKCRVKFNIELDKSNRSRPFVINQNCHTKSCPPLTFLVMLCILLVSAFDWICLVSQLQYYPNASSLPPLIIYHPSRVHVANASATRWATVATHSFGAPSAGLTSSSGCAVVHSWASDCGCVCRTRDTPLSFPTMPHSVQIPC